MNKVTLSKVRNDPYHVKGKVLLNIIFLLINCKLQIFQNLSFCHLLLYLSYKITKKNQYYQLNIWLIDFLNVYLDAYCLFIP